jgi:hypothetical protein
MNYFWASGCIASTVCLLFIRYRFLHEPHERKLLRAPGRPADVSGSYLSIPQHSRYTRYRQLLAAQGSSAGSFPPSMGMPRDLRIFSLLLLLLLHPAEAWGSAPRIQKVFDCAVWIFCRGRSSRGHLRTAVVRRNKFGSVVCHCSANATRA